jgi:hypothetical protein
MAGIHTPRNLFVAMSRHSKGRRETGAAIYYPLTCEQQSASFGGGLIKNVLGRELGDCKLEGELGVRVLQELAKGDRAPVLLGPPSIHCREG